MVWRCLFSVNIITKKYEKNSSYNVIKNELWVKIGCFGENVCSNKSQNNGVRWKISPEKHQKWCSKMNFCFKRKRFFSSLKSGMVVRILDY